ncbi:MAG TPA: MlaD family protein [Solirubrobacteraceae bacterium]|nr:MlaD family protein [Solirubrobacteraceae bacterium]
MKRAIKTHRQDFIAMTALALAAVAVAAYILAHQPAFTLGRSYYTVRAAFQNAAAVTSGQGQSVDIAGVQVGEIGGVQLQGGRAIVTMDIYKKYAPIYHNASVLLRPRTPLKDMYLALDPGTPDAGRVPAGGLLGPASTQPTVDVDQILNSLDADTRNYLLLLLAGGSQAFRDPGNAGPAPTAKAVSDLTGVFKRFAPLNRDTQTFTSLLSQRSVDIRRAINGLQQVTRALGGVDGRLTSLIDSSNTNFQAISSQDVALENALTLLPGTLQQTNTTLGKVQGFASSSATALHGLLPFAHALAPALEAARPLFRDTTPVIRNQLRPFATGVQPVARVLKPASALLASSTPKLADSISVLNALFNTLAYQPHGGQHSYLFWGSWLAHIADSLVNSQDAHGPIVRGVFMASCPSLNLFEVTLVNADPALGPLVDLLNAPDHATIKSSFCPAALP